MRINNKSPERLKRIFQKAYREREKVQTGDTWQTGVMRYIRHDHDCGKPPAFLETFGHFVWRFAPATLLMIVVFAFLFLNVDFFGSSTIFETLFTTELQYVGPLDYMGV
jgi:hypothetical protein